MTEKLLKSCSKHMSITSKNNMSINQKVKFGSKWETERDREYQGISGFPVMGGGGGAGGGGGGRSWHGGKFPPSLDIFYSRPHQS